MCDRIGIYLIALGLMLIARGAAKRDGVSWSKVCSDMARQMRHAHAAWRNRQ